MDYGWGCGQFQFVELLGLVVGEQDTRMNGAKGCGSGTASLARPGCGFGKAAAFPKRGHKVGLPAALPTESLTPLGSIPAGPQKEGSFMCSIRANLGPAQRSYAGPLPLKKGALD